MDFIQSEKELRALAASHARLARRYAAERNAYGEASWEVMVLLVPHQGEEHYRKASHEKQVLMLMADCPAAEEPVKRMTLARERYKGLERMLEHRASRISALQSLMRYARSND